MGGLFSSPGDLRDLSQTGKIGKAGKIGLTEGIEGKQDTEKITRKKMQEGQKRIEMALNVLKTQFYGTSNTNV